MVLIRIIFSISEAIPFRIYKICYIDKAIDRKKVSLINDIILLSGELYFDFFP